MIEHKVPCEECMLLPMCRHKHAGPLLEDCSLLTDWQPDISRPMYREGSKLFQLEKILKPTKWYLYSVNEGGPPLFRSKLWDREHV
jgi:hypothetical protein